MMNEFIALVLSHKAVFYYDAVAVGALLAILTAYSDWSLYFSNSKYGCEHNKIKSIKDNSNVWRLFMSISISARKRYCLTSPLKFFTDYKSFLLILCMYLCVTVLTMGYVITG